SAARCRSSAFLNFEGSGHLPAVFTGSATALENSGRTANLDSATAAFGSAAASRASFLIPAAKSRDAKTGAILSLLRSRRTGAAPFTGVSLNCSRLSGSACLDAFAPSALFFSPAGSPDFAVTALGKFTPPVYGQLLRFAPIPHRNPYTEAIADLPS